MNRRSFLKHTGAAAGVTAMQSLRGATQGVSIIVDPRDPVASASPASWAIGELRSALSTQGITARIYPRIEAAPATDRCIMVAGASSSSGRQLLKAANVSMPSSAEALCLVPGKLGGRSALLAGGNDTRGLV